MNSVHTADVAVIGAGIAGTGLAASLSGRRSVVVLEQEEQPGFHATGRSAAVFVPNYGDDLTRRLTRAGSHKFRNPDPAIFPEHLLKRRGLLRLIAQDGIEDYFQRFGGVPGIENISLAGARYLFPLLNTDGFVAASFESGVCDIDVNALLQGFIRAARNDGAQFLYNVGIRSIRRIDGSWRIETGDRTISAPVLVNAAGAWADDVAKLAGVEPVGLKVKRRSFAVVDAPARFNDEIDDWPFVVPFPLGWYAKPDSGRLLVSPGDEETVEPHDAYADDMVLAEGLDRFGKCMNFKIERVANNWAGLRTFASDERPVVGYDPEADGFFWLAGQGGFGIQTAPGLSDLAAALLEGSGIDPELGGEIVKDVAPDRLKCRVEA